MDLKDISVKNPVNVFTNEDAFAGNNTPQPPAGSEASDKSGNIIDAVVDVAKQTKDLIVDESKTLAPDVANTFKVSKKRLDSENRIINAIPNSYLYWGIVGILGYVVIKNL